MKNFTLVLSCVLLLCLAASAQPYLAPGMLNTSFQPHKVTFWDVQNAFNNYWAGKIPSINEAENAEEGGWQQFKRWEWFFEQRTFPAGNFPSPEILFQENNRYKMSRRNSSLQINSANWTFLGPHIIPTQGGGSGRINCIAISPVDTNIMWIGAACGGLWKSTNGGNTWGSNTDLLPSLSISDIAIDPTNPSTMYIATGDKYGIYYQYETWGHYSAGVLKSTDGGLTWVPTAMNYSLANTALIQRLILDSANPNILFAATGTGIFKTTDGGASWNNVRSGSMYDIEFKPDNHSIVFAGDNVGFLRSTDGGVTWNYISGVTSTERISIAVTPANSNVVYVWSEGGGFYYSSDAGLSFTPRANPSGPAGPYGYYDYVLAVSPANPNILFAGGLNVARSTDGGVSWIAVSDWSTYTAPNYVHADNHALFFMPGSATSVFSCNDGGIFKSTNQGTSFTDLSGGIDIKQYYRLSCSNLTAYLIYAGAQDNGSDKITGLNTAVRVNGADGEDCLVDYSDDNIVFVSSQGGNFYRSSDGGNSFSGISIGSGGDWTTPIIMDANNHNIMYAGYSNVWKSTNNGSTWSALPGTFDGTSIYSLEISSSNSQYIYAATFGHIYQTTNGGTTWTDRTGTLPVASAAISGIAINGSNPDNIWVTFSGFVNGQKVYISTDGGASWANISGTLPNIPANCVEYQNGSNDIVYIGTDLGVFYMDATMNDWVSYNTGLPNVVIDQLEINYPTSKIRAATYGRGIWESDLQTSTLMALDAGVSVIISPSGNSCDTLFTPDVRIRNYGLDTLHSAVLHYYLDANPETLYNWNGTLVSLATADIILPSFILTGGSHTFTAYTTAPNASTDMNSANDAHASSFSVLANPTGLPAPVTEGFVSSTFPPAPWTLENSSALWLRSSTVGGYGLSTNSAYANFWAIASGEDKLVSANLDFTNMIAPITLTFDVAYAYFTGPPPYIDTLAIDIVSDCDLNNPLLVYAKGGDDLATAPSLNSTFIPIASQWRTDTVHLDFLAGTGISHIRFLARSGYGNYCYVDNINLRDGTTNIHSLINNTSDVILYPNPAAGILNVEVPGLQQASVEIYDAVGNHISSVNKNISSERFSLNISNLSNGIYFLNIKTEGGFVSKRFTVLR